jgi:hypothetical protein
MTTRPPPNPHLTLEEWDDLIGRHLHMIEAGAEICESHAKQLMGIPEWETRALSKLMVAEKLVSHALTRLAQARQHMERKPHVS